MSKVAQLRKKIHETIGQDWYNRLIWPRHYGEAVVANARFGLPAVGLRVIGVTGTNGKTTTCNMLASILAAGGHKVGLLSSATLRFGGEPRENDTHLTTASSWLVQDMLSRMRKSGCDIVVMEISSHALVQSRILGVPIDVAIMTNLTQDHLDYHGTMENYAAAKAKLFKRAKSLSVLNVNDEYFTTFEAASRASVRTYGQGDLADTALEKVSLRADGATFSITTPERDQAVSFQIHQPGLFNVYNAMAAITAARFYGVSDEDIQKGFFDLEQVPGRMQTINEGQPFTVIIDHAHTTDALQNLYGEICKVKTKRLIIVIGCDGDRDKTKRGPIGKLSAEVGDVVYLTELENYTEDPVQIRAAVRAGMEEVPESKRAKLFEIADRREAIATALKEAKPGDIVLIPGLGNQDYRGMAEGKIAWDDREVVREELRKILKKK